MLLRKTAMKVGAKTPWSRATRASMVLLGEDGKLTFRWRNLNQVVAAGPKMTVFVPPLGIVDFFFIFIFFFFHA